MKRLGRIGYLNVLPIYHPLEAGWLRHDFTFTSGPPAELNRLIRADELDISSVSSVEYARHPDRYLLLPELAIASRGPVKSVLLLSRVPVESLDGQPLLVTSETHTSAALLRIVLHRVYAVSPRYETAPHSIRQALAHGAQAPAVLAIGDEALSLRTDPRFPHQLDLGEVWRDWTGLPFVFGVWVVRRQAAENNPERALAAARMLAESKRVGVAAIEEIVSLAALSKPNLGRAVLRRYFDRLGYDLGPDEQAGLKLFFTSLKEHGIIDHAPELEILT